MGEVLNNTREEFAGVENRTYWWRARKMGSLIKLKSGDYVYLYKGFIHENDTQHKY